VSSAAEWDPEVLTRIIHEAMKARDFPAVVAALKVLAVTDPVQAQAVLDAIHLGLALSGTSAADGTMGA
jgi:hypothetical protein